MKVSKKELKGVRSELNAVRDALDKSDSINNVLKVIECFCLLLLTF